MGLLDQAMQSDAQAFYDTDGFGETVTFNPYNGTPRSITVVINRDIAPDGDEEAHNVKEIMLVSVANHATTGISATAFNAGKDTIELAYRVGETAETDVLGHPGSIDSANLIFRIR